MSIGLITCVFLAGPMPPEQPFPRVGSLFLGMELGGSLSVGELLPIEFKPSPDADWAIIVPVPLYPGNGLDIGAFMEYYPCSGLGVRAGCGTQIPVQPMAELPSYIDHVTGSYHRFGIDFFGLVSEGRIKADVGMGVFCSLADYRFQFNDFTTQEEDWETKEGSFWTIGVTPQLGMDLRVGDGLILGGRLLAPVSLFSGDGDPETENEGFGSAGAGLWLRVHLKHAL